MNRYQVSIGGKWLHTYLNSDKRFKGRVWVEDIQYAEPSIKRTIETAGDADGGTSPLTKMPGGGSESTRKRSGYAGSPSGI